MQMLLQKLHEMVNFLLGLYRPITVKFWENQLFSLQVRFNKNLKTEGLASYSYRNHLRPWKINFNLIRDIVNLLFKSSSSAVFDFDQKFSFFKLGGDHLSPWFWRVSAH